MLMLYKSGKVGKVQTPTYGFEFGFGDTDLFITTSYQFKSVNAMLTNFHLPESTLLMLVSAFAGYDAIMNAYQHAINKAYRFFSYGDAMFLNRRFYNKDVEMGLGLSGFFS